jgi:hypothetical protein
VVAHCCEPLDWLLELASVHKQVIARVIVYTKCNHKVQI